MSKKFIVAATLLFLLAFAIPFEHKYDKLFRFFSLTLIPNGVEVSKSYQRLIYFYASDLIAIALLFLGTPVRRFFSNPLWIVFLCALVSIVVSPFRTYPVAYTHLLQLLTPVILFSFLRNAFSEEERSKVTKLVFIALIAAGVLESAIAIAQYFHGAPLGLRLLGETNQMSYIWTDEGMRIRAQGTLPHANVLGGFPVLSIFSTYAFIEKGNRWLFGILPFLIFAMILSFSRSALFAWLIGSCFWFYQNRKVGSLAAITALCLIGCFGLLYPQIKARGGILNYNSVAKESDAVRLYHQKMALQIIKQAPLFGLGFTQFSERAPHSEDASGEIKATGPHNIFLFLACETGLISLAAFLWFILSLFSKNGDAALTSAMIALLFIGFCDFYPILFQQGKLMFFLIAGLLARPKLELSYA